MSAGAILRAMSTERSTQTPAVIGLLALTMLGSCGTSQTPTAIDGFVARQFRGAAGDLPYRLFIPDNYDPSRAYPLIVYLHGGAGVGRDNVAQISGGNRIGSHLWTSSELQARQPSFVVAPQSVDKGWQPRAQLVVDLIAALGKEFNLDRTRYYVTGQSMGGYGTWDLIVRWPNLFAAAVPLCGGGRVDAVDAIRDLPIWVFHGARDQTVPVEQSREIVNALRQLKSQVKYTEYPDVGHDVWTRAYREPDLITWLFAQRRQQR